MKPKPTSRALTILNRRHPPTPADLKLRASFRHQNDIAELILLARTSAGLSQRQLAQRIGTSPSVISRLESANYNAHSLAILRRIATALQLQLQLRFIPQPPATTQPTSRSA